MKILLIIFGLMYIYSVLISLKNLERIKRETKLYIGQKKTKFLDIFFASVEEMSPFWMSVFWTGCIHIVILIAYFITIYLP